MKRSALAAALALSVAVSPAADIDFLTKAKPATGHSVMGKGEVEFAIPPQQARFIKLEAHGSGDFAAAAAEIRLVGKGGAVVDPKRWKLVGASGGEATAKSAYDADPATSWIVPAAPGPHWVAIDLGRVESFSALRYVPAADGTGAVGPFQLFVGHDGKAFDAIASGTLIGGAHGEGGGKAAAPAKIDLVRKVWASSDLVQHPIAISLDDQGRAYVAETYRYEGRGVIDNRGKERREREDLQIQRVEDRRRTVKEWLRDGEIAKVELPKRADYFKEGDDYFTKFSEVIALIEDRDRDGTADDREVFADGFNDVLDGAGAGVLPYGGSVYYTCIPNLWKLEDEDGDGISDRRKALHTGFGVHVGWYGHDMHGLIMGPDGKLYFSIADRGFHVETPEGKTLRGPDTGAVFRCWPDGSGLEVVHRGLRNPQELAFDDFGNLFTGDNNCDAGDQARLVYLVEGGDSGWDICVQSLTHRGPWLRENMWKTRPAKDDPSFPAWIIPTQDYVESGPSGIAHYPGTGLPAAYAGHFLLCDFRGATGSVQAFAVEPDGAGFRKVGQHTLDNSASVSDVTFGYDGRIYVADWGNEWDINPRSNIYTLEHPESRAQPVVAEVRQIFFDGFAERSIAELTDMLGHADQRVRTRAQLALADKGASSLAPFLRVLRDERATLPRLHAIWGIGIASHADRSALPPLAAFAGDNDAEVRAQAIKVLGDHKFRPALDAMLAALSAPEPRVRFHAGIALGKLGDAAGARAALQMLADNADDDALLRHAAVMALSGCADAEAILKEGLGADSRSVRLGCVLALRKLGSPLAAEFLKDADAQIVTEAARAIYDLEMDAVLPMLAARLGGEVSGALMNEGFLRRAVQANYRVGGAAEAMRLAKFLAERAGELGEEHQTMIVECLANWQNPPERDGVWGKWRPLPARPDGVAKPAMRAHISAIAGAVSGKAKDLARPLAAQYRPPRTPEELAKLIADGTEGAADRIDALNELFKKGSGAGAPFFAAAKGVVESGSAPPAVRAAARTLWAQADKDGALPLLTAALSSGEESERQAAIRDLAALGTEGADAVLGKLADSLAAGSLDPALALDVAEAAGARPSLKPKIDALRAEMAAKGPWAFQELVAYQGGDPDKGREVFLGNLAAQCLRCHKVGGTGGDVGPPLDGIAARQPREYLLRSLLDPQADIALGYGIVSVTLKSGRNVSGILKGEDAVHLQIQVGETTEEVPARDIAARTPPASGMPPMGALLSPRDLRDVLAYVASLK